MTRKEGTFASTNSFSLNQNKVAKDPVVFKPPKFDLEL
jgi:hypothetical protein